MNQLCKVCEEPAAGFHFGAFTCEGCKSFFGRTYNNLQTLNECKNNGRCVIDKKNRTSCKACRLKKCFMVGMSKSGSRYGRRSNWFKMHCLLQEQAANSETFRLNNNKLNGSSMPFGVSGILGYADKCKDVNKDSECSSPVGCSPRSDKSPDRGYLDGNKDSSLSPISRGLFHNPWGIPESPGISPCAIFNSHMPFLTQTFSPWMSPGLFQPHNISPTLLFPKQPLNKITPFGETLVVNKLETVEKKPVSNEDHPIDLSLKRKASSERETPEIPEKVIKTEVVEKDLKESHLPLDLTKREEMST